MKCKQCKNDLKTGTIVYTDGDSVVCGDICKKAFDAARVQKELVSKWKKARYLEKRFEAPCAIAKIGINTKDPKPIVEVVVRMPGGVSTDALKDFSGQALTLTIVKGTVMSLEKKEKPKDVPPPVEYDNPIDGIESEIKKRKFSKAKTAILAQAEQILENHKKKLPIPEADNILAELVKLPMLATPKAGRSVAVRRADQG